MISRMHLQWLYRHCGKRFFGLGAATYRLVIPRRSKYRWSASHILTVIMVCFMSMVVVECKNRNASPSATHWDRIVEGQNKEVYFVDRKAIELVSADVVRVSVKYVPATDQFVISLKDLSKEFGGEAQDAGPEYTISTWEFNCAKPEGRCVRLLHFKKGSKIASYEYPNPAWSPLEKAPSTKALRDVVCAEAVAAKK